VSCPGKAVETAGQGAAFVAAVDDQEETSVETAGHGAAFVAAVDDQEETSVETEPQSAT
jgi:hypothetical protein